jgi:hypothetical protein
MAEAGSKFAEFEPEYGRTLLPRAYELVIYSAPTP